MATIINSFEKESGSADEVNCVLSNSFDDRRDTYGYFLHNYGKDKILQITRQNKHKNKKKFT